jgi:hypothetical protein
VQIYLPMVSAAEILALASRLYSSHRLSWVDPHTVRCDAGRVSYVPIPRGGTENYAGLLTVDPPASLRRGAVYNVIVRQVTNTLVKRRQEVTWRRVLGAFQLAIPVKAKDRLLLTEERNLAVLRWIGEAIPAAHRWYPVFQRYLSQIAGRVSVFGGNPSGILPSPIGAVPHKWPIPGPGPRPHSTDHTGKIVGLIFDHFGDFEGILLDTDSGEHRFDSREREVRDLAERAWRERLRITVRTEHGHPHRLRRIIVRQPPESF